MADRDPDVESRPAPLRWDAVAAVALGGVLGAEARYGLGVLAPHHPDQFPWTTVAINVAGCLLIGVLLAALARRADPPRLARPFLGTGVLGGFTTFSAFGVDAVTLARAHRWATAAGYLALTTVLCLLAVVAGAALVDRVAAGTSR